MRLEAVLCIESPIGQLALGATEVGVAELTILSPGERRAEFSHSKLANSHLELAARQVREFFAGERSDFDVPLDLAGTAFQNSVWAALQRVQKGQVRSYGEIAAEIGKPLAARAVGGAVGSNPVPLIIGCHRVLGSTKTLTGYSGGGGLLTKRWLLNFEGIEYRA